MKNLFKENKYKLVSVFILVIAIFLYKSVSLITFAKNSAEKKYDVYTREVLEIPVLRSNLNLQEEDDTKSTSFDINSLTSKSVYIEDIDTATQLFEKNGERVLLPASTTKIMTALVARQEYKLDDVFTIPDIFQIDGYSIGLFKGEKMRVDQLLKAALIQSSNDAAYTLALNHPNGLDGFVKLMNQKVADFNLKSTYFENPAGFDNDSQRSSAHDLAIISKEFMKDDFLREVVGAKEDIISDESGVYKHYLYSTNEFLGVDESVVGIKTGTTEGAHQVLITQFNREDRNILIIVMGSDDRYEETSQLIDWVFDEFIWLTPEQIIEES
ncbi:D-alanyl-D-alanine carboxypeptidase [Patescibacteria group bacterium]|nr:D-alanyl-D-alanine carboxypeptidase [Patescibacteria group bacterium]